MRVLERRTRKACEMSAREATEAAIQERCRWRTEGHTSWVELESLLDFLDVERERRKRREPTDAELEAYAAAERERLAAEEHG